VITLLIWLAVPVVLAAAAFWFVRTTSNQPLGERILRVGGTLGGVFAAVVIGFAAVILSNFMIGAHHTPVGPLIAIGGNILIVYFTYSVTGHKLLAAVPGVAWFLVTILLSRKGPGSDLLIQGNWVGLLTLLGGSIAWGLSAYRVIDRRPIKPVE
jgi:hypothetical protein